MCIIKILEVNIKVVGYKVWVKKRGKIWYVNWRNIKI